MKLLHEKGHVKAMNLAVNMTPLINAFLGEHKEELLKGCVANSISMILKVDPEIKEAFDKAACELMLDKVFKDLDLKQDENFKPTAQDLFAKSVAEALISQMVKKGTDYGKDTSSK
ncbi:hypothetical protein SDC9_212287 [bioreactor metagenome]|uniref:Uncharacterized protein n=1 Tax=bioreactor metagenome TaxID=1076179 RepID=A0A645JMI7_9ZZZZ